MMASTIPSPTHFSMKPSYLQYTPLNAHLEVITTVRPTKPRRRKPSFSSSKYNVIHFHVNSNFATFNRESCSFPTVLTRVCSDGGGGGGGAIDATQQQHSSVIPELLCIQSLVHQFVHVASCKMLLIDKEFLINGFMILVHGDCRLMVFTYGFTLS